MISQIAQTQNPTKKSCSICKEPKLLIEFQARGDNKQRGVVKYRAACKNCEANRAKTKYRTRPEYISKQRLTQERRKIDPRRKVREYQLKRNFNITLQDYENLLAGQGGVCAICRRPPSKRSLAVDHCHKTGKIRGLLCASCNYRRLPPFRDDPSLLRRAALYLEGLL